MKRTTMLNGVVIFVALLPMLYLLLIWNSLPPTVALHYNVRLEVDRTGSKNELWLATGILTVVSIAVYFLLKNLHRIDPKRKGVPASPTFSKLAVGLVIFLSALGVLVVESAKGAVVWQNFLFPLMGLLFAFIGNYMHNIRPNYFAGLRLPWTLSSDDNWRRTHQLAGKIWFAGGLLIAALSLFAPRPLMTYLFIGLVVLMVIVPSVYSFRLFKQANGSHPAM